MRAERFAPALHARIRLALAAALRPGAWLALFAVLGMPLLPVLDYLRVRGELAS